MVDKLQEIFKNFFDIYNIKDEPKRQEVDKKRKSQKDLIEGIYIFVSFDLINSTIFKSRHKKIWAAFVSSFYESVSSNFGLNTGTLVERNDEINNTTDRRPFGNYTFREYTTEIAKTNGFHLWKLLGDEVLFYHKVTSAEELYATIQFIDYKRKKLITEAIDTYLKNSGLKKTDSEAIEKESLLLQYFNIKTTVWVGNCAYDAKNISLDMPNAIYGAENEEENELFGSKYDFMGPDIDEGFRLCSSAEKGLMLVSPKLVYLLLLAFENNNDRLNALNQNFKITNYISLKGVWEQRPYPLILFCQSEGGKIDSIDVWKEQFEYDAFENSHLFKNIDACGTDFFHDDKFSILNLHKIYKDIVRDKEMIKLKEQLERQKEFLKNTNYPGIQKNIAKFEYHISCLCRDEKGRYWVTKHPTYGWSFGCVQITSTNYCNYVKQAYKEKYKLDIEIDENSPILSFYKAKRSEEMGGTSILGTILLVKLKESTTDEQIESKLLSYDDCLSQLGSETKIDNFDVALKKAEALSQERKGP